jgi:hypothetical protein
MGRRCSKMGGWHKMVGAGMQCKGQSSLSARKPGPCGSLECGLRGCDGVMISAGKAFLLCGRGCSGLISYKKVEESWGGPVARLASHSLTGQKFFLVFACLATPAWCPHLGLEPSTWEPPSFYASNLAITQPSTGKSDGACSPLTTALYAAIYGIHRFDGDPV